MMHRQDYTLRLIIIIACFGIAVFPLFYKLGEAPLRAWDESLYAMRAYYMAETGGYLANFDHFPGITFYRNLKPPLGTWFQALSYKTFGYSEWALRLPVALFSVLLLALVFVMTGRAVRHTYSGALAGLILVASPGFLRDHVARTGDHDAILIFWMTAGLFFCFFAQQAESRRIRRMYLALLGLTLFAGFLTKSFFAFALCPAFLLFLILSGRLPAFLRDPFTWVAAGLAAGSIGLYYLRMETAFPGFWEFESDTVLGRYLKIQDGHQLAWNYYIAEFFSRRFFPWFLLLPLHLYLTIRAKSQPFRAFGLLLWLAFIAHFVMITCSTTKLSWYDAPLYPIAALMAGSAVVELFRAEGRLWSRALIAAVTGLVLGFTYYRGLQDIAQAGPASDDERYQPFMRYLQKERPDLKKYMVYCHEYNGQVGYTAKLLNDHRGYDISVAVYYPEQGFEPDIYIMVCSAEKEERVRSLHKVAAEIDWGACRLLRIE